MLSNAGFSSLSDQFLFPGKLPCKYLKLFHPLFQDADRRWLKDLILPAILFLHFFAKKKIPGYLLKLKFDRLRRSHLPPGGPDGCYAVLIMFYKNYAIQNFLSMVSGLFQKTAGG